MAWNLQTTSSQSWANGPPQPPPQQQPMQQQHYPQQQQPQYAGSPGQPQYAQQPMYPGQPGAGQQYPGQPGQQQYYPPGQEPGCCGPPQPQQQQPGCCDPAQPLMASPETSSCGCLTQCCDCTTFVVWFFVFLTILAFALVVALSSSDNIYGEFDVETTAELEAKISSMVVSLGPGSAAASCRAEGLVGSWGKMCYHDSLSAAAMTMNISRWVNFRATLYFIAMMGTLITAIYIMLVHRAKPSTSAPQTLVESTVPGQPPQYAPSPPITFYGTPLYHILRCAWFIVGLIVLLWIATEMYQFWWFIGLYRKHTTGELQDFWQGFNDKFVSTVFFAFLYLCWPINNMILEMLVFLFGVIPWFMVRILCIPTVETTRMPPETELQDIPCCIRMDMFFVECNQGKRLGCSTRMYEMVSGTREPFFDCCDFPTAQPPGTYPPAAAGGMQPPTQPGTMGGSTPARQISSSSVGADDDEVMTGSGMKPPTSPTPTRGFPPAPAVSASMASMRSSAAFSTATSDDEVDVRASRSKEKKKKDKKDKEKKKKDKHRHDSDDESGVESLRKSKEKKSKKDKEKKSKKDKHRASMDYAE